jgi:hypothetical protein
VGLFTRSAPHGDNGDGGADARRWLQHASGDAVFDGAEFVDRFAVLRWESARDGSVLADAMNDGNAAVKTVGALRERHGARLAGVHGWSRRRPAPGCSWGGIAASVEILEELSLVAQESVREERAG